MFWVEGNTWVKNDDGKYLSTRLSSYCGGYTRKFAENLVRALERELDCKGAFTARHFDFEDFTTSRSEGVSWTSTRRRCSQAGARIARSSTTARRRPSGPALGHTPQRRPCAVPAQKRVKVGRAQQ